MTYWFDARNGRADTRSTPVSAGALLGWGVFTTLGIWQRRPFAIDRHLARLRRDAARTRIVLDCTDEELSASLELALGESGIEEGIARVTVTQKGDGRWNTDTGSDISLALNAIAPEIRTRPVRLQLSPHRVEARRPLAGVKSTSYLDYQVAWLEASEAGFDDALLCNSSGMLCEGSRSNIFWTRGGSLFTPSDETGCLPGIGRELVAEWAVQQGMQFRTGAFSTHELQTAEEVFVTASTTGPRPVSALQLATDWELTWEVNGPVTKSLQQTWLDAATE